MPARRCHARVRLSPRSYGAEPPPLAGHAGYLKHAAAQHARSEYVLAWEAQEIGFEVAQAGTKRRGTPPHCAVPQGYHTLHDNTALHDAPALGRPSACAFVMNDPKVGGNLRNERSSQRTPNSSSAMYVTRSA